MKIKKWNHFLEFLPTFDTPGPEHFSFGLMRSSQNQPSSANT